MCLNNADGGVIHHGRSIACECTFHYTYFICRSICSSGGGYLLTYIFLIIYSVKSIYILLGAIGAWISVCHGHSHNPLWANPTLIPALPWAGPAQSSADSHEGIWAGSADPDWPDCFEWHWLKLPLKAGALMSAFWWACVVTASGRDPY